MWDKPGRFSSDGLSIFKSKGLRDTYSWISSLRGRGTYCSPWLFPESFRWFLFLLLIGFTFTISSYRLFICIIFDKVLSNIEVFSVKLSANVFLFGGLIVQLNDWFTYLDLVNSSISCGLILVVNPLVHGVH